ncbi:hypothetical protein EZS27_014622 [termite gut metagenome]|uniref:Uncharacterized protein n=1 Tax=termite gut metagenome TaxID=433724 RepID=A0A5J4RU21_9ZZZZ
MSRSRKHTPYFNIACCQSNKKSKTYCHRLFRKCEKQSIRNDELLPIKMDEVMNEWDFNGDGKFFWKNCPREELRK